MKKLLLILLLACFVLCSCTGQKDSDGTAPSALPAETAAPPAETAGPEDTASLAQTPGAIEYTPEETEPPTDAGKTDEPHPTDAGEIDIGGQHSEEKPTNTPKPTTSPTEDPGSHPTGDGGGDWGEIDS